jgi:hypothetical protein
MKPVDIILSRGNKGKGGGNMMEEMNLTTAHGKHIWKRDNETPCTTNIN